MLFLLFDQFLSIQFELCFRGLPLRRHGHLLRLPHLRHQLGHQLHILQRLLHVHLLCGLQHHRPLLHIQYPIQDIKLIRNIIQ